MSRWPEPAPDLIRGARRFFVDARPRAFGAAGDAGLGRASGSREACISESYYHTLIEFRVYWVTPKLLRARRVGMGEARRVDQSNSARAPRQVWRAAQDDGDVRRRQISIAPRPEPFAALARAAHCSQLDQHDAVRTRTGRPSNA